MLYIKDIIPDHCRVEFSETKACIVFRTTDVNFFKEQKIEDFNSVFELNAEFHDAIQADECRFKVNNCKLEIQLVKKNPNLKWTNVLKDKLENTAKIPSSTGENANKRFSVSKTRESSSSSPSPPPTSSKTAPQLSPNIGSIDNAQAKKSPSENPNYGLTGLVNLGNTCYMNAAIQFLINVTDLRDYFLGNLLKKKFDFIKIYNLIFTIT